MNRRGPLILGLLILLCVSSVAGAQDSGERLPTPAGETRDSAGSGLPVTNIRDGGFETDGIWREESGLFSFINCTSALCGGDAVIGPKTGTHFIWFGGSSTAQKQFIEQKLYIPRTSDVSMNLNYRVGAYDAAAKPKFKVMVDGQVVRTIPITGTTVGYISVNIDLSAYANGGLHTLRIHFKQGSGGANTIGVDDIEFYKGYVFPLTNAGFESATASWTLANATNDDRVCNAGAVVVSYSGNCAFQFKGSANEKASIKFEFGILRDALAPRAPGHWKTYVGAFVRASPSATGFMRMILTMSNGSKLKSTVQLAGTGAYAWKQVAPKRYPNGLSIVYVEIIVKNTSAKGKILLDDFEMVENTNY